MPPVSRETLNARIETYFQAVRWADLPVLLSLIAEGATFTVHAAAGDPSSWGSVKTFTGKEELRRLYLDFFAALRPLSCTVPNRAIDSEVGTVVTKQIYVGEGKDGSRIEMDNCNFFDFNEAGLIVRIVNWSSSRPVS